MTDITSGQRRSKMAKKKRSSRGISALSQTLAAIEKVGLKDDIVDLDINSLQESRPHITSGSVMIDRTIGGPKNPFGVIPCPGFPIGGIINIYGHESSGKTTLCLATAAEVVKAGGSVLYVDWENEIVPSYAAQLGVDIANTDGFQLLQPKTLEDGMKAIWSAAHFGVDLIVIDSVGAGIPKEWYEDQALKEKGNMGRVGLIAAKWSRFLPQVKAKLVENGGTCLAISQIRANISTMGYGPKHTVQGGNIWKFQSAIRILLKKFKTLKTKEDDYFTGKKVERPTGIVVRAKLEKCKVGATQGNECDFYIRFGEGIDNISSYIDVAISYGLIERKGAWHYYQNTKGDRVSAQGAENLRQQLMEDPESMDLLIQNTRDILFKNDGTAIPTSIGDEIGEDPEEMEEIDLDFPDGIDD